MQLWLWFFTIFLCVSLYFGNWNSGFSYWVSQKLKKKEKKREQKAEQSSVEWAALHSLYCIGRIVKSLLFVYYFCFLLVIPFRMSLVHFSSLDSQLLLQFYVLIVVFVRRNFILRSLCLYFFYSLECIRLISVRMF